MPLRVTEPAATRDPAFDSDEHRRAQPLTPRPQPTSLIELLSQVHGRLLPINTPIVISDISPRGFAISSVVPFPDRSVQAFRFLAPDGMTTIHLWARAIEVQLADAAGTVRAAFEFLHFDSPHTARLIERLLRQLGEVREPCA